MKWRIGKNTTLKMKCRAGPVAKYFEGSKRIMQLSFQSLCYKGQRKKQKKLSYSSRDQGGLDKRMFG